MTESPRTPEDAEAAALRLADVLEPLWRASRRWTAAVVLALFPILFIVDKAVDTRLSPVLPGLAVLLLLILGLPFALMELMGRLYRRKPIDRQVRKAARAAQAGRSALVLAGAWVALWFAVGA